MPTTTTYFKLKKPVGDDLYNHLTIDNPNMDAIDTAMHNNQQAAICTATHSKVGTVHTLTRQGGKSPMFRFVATAAFAAGDTFTVDGQAVTATLPDGSGLSAGAFVINSNVLACLVGTQMTVYTVAGVGAVDAATLDGHPADYFAVESETAKKSTSQNVTLNTGLWTSSGELFIQSVNAAGVTAASNIVVSPNANSWDKAVAAQVRCTAQGNASLTFTAAELPDAAVVMTVIIIG